MCKLLQVFFRFPDLMFRFHQVLGKVSSVQDFSKGQHNNNIQCSRWLSKTKHYVQNSFPSPIILWQGGISPLRNIICLYIDHTPRAVKRVVLDSWCAYFPSYSVEENVGFDFGTFFVSAFPMSGERVIKFYTFSGALLHRRGRFDSNIRNICWMFHMKRCDYH